MGTAPPPRAVFARPRRPILTPALALALFLGAAAPVPAGAAVPGAGGGIAPSTPLAAAGSAVVHFGDLARQASLAGTVAPPIRYRPRNPELGEDRRNEYGEPGAGITGLEIFTAPPSFILDVASPSPSRSFMGLDDIPMVDSSYIVIPPDVGGAVGPTRIFQGQNNNYRVFDKATGAVLATLGTATFWAPVVPGLARLELTDPRTLYDPYQDRFIAVMQTVTGGAGLILVGVSQTGDPAGAWNLYSFATSATIDFPTVGFNKNWIAVAINRYTAGGSFSRGITLVVDYPSARTGTGTATLFTQAAGSHFCSAPCVTYSAATETLYVVTHLSSSGATYVVDTITGTSIAPVYTGGPGRTRPGGGWVQPSGNILPQSAPNSGASACGATPCPMETQDAQIRSAPVFRDGFIYYAQTVGLPVSGLTHTGVQWTRLTTPDGFTTDGGRIEDATATSTNGGKWYAFPHIAANANHDLLVGYSQFSSAQHPAAGYSMHLGGDAAGSMRDALIYHAGEDYYHKTFSTATGRNRWGDFSTAQVDPTDDMTLWALQEYGKTRTSTDDGNSGSNGSRWSTWWAGVAPPSVTIASGPSQNEGDAGTSAFNFTVHLSYAYGLPVTVNFQTVDGTATTADNDYQGLTSSVIIPAGSTSAPLPIQVVGDTGCEGNQTFGVALLSAGPNIPLGVATSATATILEDDDVTLTTSAGTGGVISPAGPVVIACGGNQTFDILADSCHVVLDVLVDGNSQGALPSYTFTGATGPHTISATFAERLALGETHADASCNGGTDGSIDLTVTGAAAPIGYVWSHGPTTEDVSGLAAGAYTVTVTDANGCVKQLLVNIAEASLIVLGETHNDVCTGGADGAIDLTVSGGTPGYTFAWSHGPTTEDVSGLAAGTYTVVVTDAAGCVKNLQATIPVRQYAIVPSAGPNGSISPAVSTPVDCGTLQKFSITPDPGYTIAQLLIDGSPEPPTASYTFTDVQGPHTIDVTFVATTGVGERPTEFALGAVTPNPVRGELRVPFALPAAGRVRVAVVDLQGRERAVIAEGDYPAGWHFASWRGRTTGGDAGAGVYFVRYRVAGRTFMRKFALMK